MAKAELRAGHGGNSSVPKHGEGGGVGVCVGEYRRRLPRADLVDEAGFPPGWNESRCLVDWNLSRALCVTERRVKLRDLHGVGAECRDVGEVAAPVLCPHRLADAAWVDVDRFGLRCLGPALGAYLPRAALLAAGTGEPAHRSVGRGREAQRRDGAHFSSPRAVDSVQRALPLRVASVLVHEDHTGAAGD